MARISFVTLLFLSRVSISGAFLFNGPKRLTEWYSGVADLQSILNSECSTQYHQYLRVLDLSSATTATASDTLVNTQVRYGNATCQNNVTENEPAMHSSLQDTVDCLLDTISPTKRSSMSSAAITLAWLPTAMLFLGSTTAESGLLLLHRPILGVLLSFASPAVSPTRAHDHFYPLEILRRTPSMLAGPIPRTRTTCLISLLEYLLSLMSLANIAHTSYQLCRRVVFSFAPELTYLPLLFSLIAALCHLGGGLATHLRVRLQATAPPTPTTTKHSHGRPTILHLRPGTHLTWLISWLTSIGSVFWLVYGTFMFSGSLFVTLESSLVISARYIVSVLVCRAVLVYELSGMKREVVFEEGDEGSDGMQEGSQMSVMVRSVP